MDALGKLDEIADRNTAEEPTDVHTISAIVGRSFDEILGGGVGKWGDAKRGRTPTASLEMSPSRLKDILNLCQGGTAVHGLSVR